MDVLSWAKPRQIGIALRVIDHLWSYVDDVYLTGANYTSGLAPF